MQEKLLFRDCVLGPRKYYMKIFGLISGTLGLLSCYTKLQIILHFFFCQIIVHIIYFLYHSTYYFDKYPIIIGSALTLTYLIYKRNNLFRTFYLLFSYQGEFKQELVPWTENWAKEFSQEKERMENLLKPLFGHLFKEGKGIIHIGSTNIKNIKFTKPIIDMALALDCSEFPNNFKNKMEKLGYYWIGDAPHNPEGGDKWFFREIDSNLGFDIHILTNKKAHDWLDDQLIFLEYLSLFSDEREKYENVKVKNHLKDHRLYSIGKQKVLQELRNNSYEWNSKKKRN